MASRGRRPEPPPIEVRQFSSAVEIDRGIAKLRKRIEDVLGLSQFRFDDPRIDNVASDIRESIRDIFGDRSPEFNEHGHLRIWWDGNYLDDDVEKQKEFTAGIHRSSILLEGLIARLEEKREDLVAGTSGSRVAGQATTGIRLFISHSSADRELAGKVADLMRVALRLSASEIRCTSVDAYRLPAGADTNAQLRTEVHDADVLLGIVSDKSIRSLYVIFELGARWGAKLDLVPLLAPGTPASVLGGPLAGINALSCDSEDQIHQLVADVARYLGTNPEQASTYGEALRAVRSVKAAAAPDPPGRSSPQSPDLDKDALAILLDLAKEGDASPTDAAQLLGISLPKAQYYLEELGRRGFAQRVGTAYRIREIGRKYLGDSGLLD